MIIKKSPKGDLESRRNMFLLIGLVMVLALVYVAFELFATQEKSQVMTVNEEEYVDVMDENVMATDQTPPPPAPAVQQQTEVVINIVDDNIKVTSDWNFSQDFDESAVVEEYEPIEIVQEVVDDTPPVRIAEEMPEFIGGEEALYKFLGNELKYPTLAKENLIQGTVLVEFVIERDGSASNVKVLVPLFPDCDQEAVRVIKSMPKWKPGKQMGKPVRCFYNIPIRFTLQ
jgi:periplasmic protein TonB